MKSFFVFFALVWVLSLTYLALTPVFKKIQGPVLIAFIIKASLFLIIATILRLVLGFVVQSPGPYQDDSALATFGAFCGLATSALLAYIPILLQNPNVLV